MKCEENVRRWPYVMRVDSANFCSLVQGLFLGVAVFTMVDYKGRDAGRWHMRLYRPQTTGLSSLQPLFNCGL